MPDPPQIAFFSLNSLHNSIMINIIKNAPGHTLGKGEKIQCLKMTFDLGSFLAQQYFISVFQASPHSLLSLFLCVYYTLFLLD